MDAPAFRAPLGRTVRLTLRNDTAWAHGIHLHGHHFEVLSRGGRPDPHRDRRDTVLVMPDEPVEIAFVADNPGRWLLHCHMLGHQASGMLSWFEVG
jgi:FtsP/CotA-like multicopper oxidase with cupredoxin domain